jgi:hypothetical protein
MQGNIHTRATGTAGRPGEHHHRRRGLSPGRDPRSDRRRSGARS